MSDRIKSFTVHLDRDYKDEDAEEIRRVILGIRGVGAVEPSATEFADLDARVKLREEMRAMLIAFLYPERAP